MQLALPFGFFVGSDSLVHDSDGFIVGTVNDFLVPVVDGFFVESASGDIDFEDHMGQPWQAGQHRLPLRLLAENPTTFSTPNRTSLGFSE